MKNIGKSIMTTVCIAILTVCAFVIDIVPTSATILKRHAIEAERRPALGTYAETGVNSLPLGIKSAVISKYIAYCIHHVSADENGVYKITLKNEHSGLRVYYDKDGEFLKQEQLKPVQVVALE